MKCLLLSFSLAALSTGIWAQGFFGDASVKMGFSSFAPDDRSFAYAPWIEEWFTSTSPHSNNIETFVCFHKSVFKYNRMSYAIGLGYSLYESRFPTLISNAYFNNFIQIEYLVKRYRRSSIFVPFSMQFALVEKQGAKVSAGITILNSLAFNKKIRELKSMGNIVFNRNKLEINNTELNPYIEFQYKKLSFSGGYRLINYNRPDRAIFSVYNNPSTGAMIQPEIPYDFYNPTKLWFILGYDLSPKKNKNSANRI
jgi:hypothetical protein